MSQDRLEDFIPESLQSPPPKIEAPRRSAPSWQNSFTVGIVFAGCALIVFLAIATYTSAFKSYGYQGRAWSYTFVDVEFSNPLSGELAAYEDALFKEQIDFHGRTGWELVSSGPSPRRGVSGPVYRLLFKRPDGDAISAEVAIKMSDAMLKANNERHMSALKAESTARAKRFEDQLQPAGR